ncbi:MAG: ClbS/DfsB family four-helix bundle protein [Chloroflexi bacterium]|nr:ClbS/DfsB family four-helix bundle protein [Chloroflexota bacterium]
MSLLDALLEDLEKSFADLQGAIDGLTHEQLVTAFEGEWSVRDMLGHIVGWHHEMDDALERIARGERPVPEGVDYSDGDAWNARFVETWRNASPEAVVAELAASKALFVEAARQVPDEKFEEGRSAYRIITTTGTSHYAEHAPVIRAWREREGI